MNDLLDLKPILHSKRANVFYLEHCRVMQKDGRVLYLTEAKNNYQYWNIPIANTTSILLGTGTSITQAAVRLLASAGVMIGFCGGGATPLFQSTEIEWLSPQNEYRPTEYVQNWLHFWFNDTQRLAVAKSLQCSRIQFLTSVWNKDPDLQDYGFVTDEADICHATKQFGSKIKTVSDVNALLSAEAEFTKNLYRFAAKCTGTVFSRKHESTDSTNSFLNHGNYLAYGLAATALWTLGIPFAFAVMHGKTRRGALVFDIADLIKDAIVLPSAFIYAKENLTESQFRQNLLNKFIRHQALDFMFSEIKKIASASWETEYQ